MKPQNMDIAPIFVFVVVVSSVTTKALLLHILRALYLPRYIYDPALH